MVWEDYISESENNLSIDVEIRPKNEEEQHFYKKIQMCWILDKKGFNSIKTEDDENNKGLRFDITCQAEDSSVGVEIGNLNTPARKLEDRSKRSYEAGVDCIYWWPKKPLNEKMDMAVEITQKLNPEECGFANRSETAIETDRKECGFWHGSFPPKVFNLALPEEYCFNNDEGSKIPPVYYLDLVHLFEPNIWHEKYLGSEDNQKGLHSFT